MGGYNCWFASPTFFSMKFVVGASCVDSEAKLAFEKFVKDLHVRRLSSLSAGVARHGTTRRIGYEPLRICLAGHCNAARLYRRSLRHHTLFECTQAPIRRSIRTDLLGPSKRAYACTYPSSAQVTYHIRQATPGTYMLHTLTDISRVAYIVHVEKKNYLHREYAVFFHLSWASSGKVEQSIEYVFPSKNTTWFSSTLRIAS